eukprot:5749020-Alexandrium_andersonii.AAC.1
MVGGLRGGRRRRRLHGLRTPCLRRERAAPGPLRLKINDLNGRPGHFASGVPVLQLARHRVEPARPEWWDCR